VPTLDLLLPTYRWGAYVRAYIGYLAVIIEDASIDVRLHIGDNSCNPEKHDFLRSIVSPKIALHLHPVNVGVHPNVTHLFKHSSGEFVQLIGDDDWIHPTCFAHGTFLERNSECIACAGFFAGIPPLGGDQLVCFNDRFMTSDPVGRAIDYVQYLHWETGVNWLALAAHRRSTMALYIEYTERNPFQFYFRDQVLSQFALLLGPVKGLREGFQFYNIRRPEEGPAHMEAEFKSLEAVGLAPWLYYHYDFWMACEYAAAWLYRGLPDASFSYRVVDADQIFVKLFDRYRNNYMKNTSGYEDHFRQAGIEDAMHTVLDDPSAITGLRGLTKLFEKMSPGAGRLYADFLQKEMVVQVI
jgi:glycosyltransferase involved in cell wall biosynthesis